MKPVFIIALVAVAMIGVMVPNVFAIASFVDQTKDPLNYIDRYFGEPEYKEWFDENYSQYSSIYEAVGLEESISIAYPSNWNVDLDFPPEIFIDTGIPKSKFGLLEYYPNGIIIQREDGVNQQLTDNDLMYNLQLHESKFCGSNWDFEYPVVSQECKNYGVSGKEYNLVSNHRSQTIFHENDMRLWEYIGYGPYFEYPTKGSVTNIQVGDTNWTVTITNEAEKFNQAFHYCVINSFKVGNLYENINQCEEDVSLKNLSFSPTNKNLKFKPEPDCGFFVGSVDGVCKWQESDNPESVGIITNLDEFIPEKFGIIEHDSNYVVGRSEGMPDGNDVWVSILVYSDDELHEHFEEFISDKHDYPITTKTIAGATCVEYNRGVDWLDYVMICNKDNFEIHVSAVDDKTRDSNMKQVLKKIDGPLSLPKISDSKGGGCLIATATYGSEMSTEVQQLRELRDNQLLQTESGIQFMEMFNDVYYSFSPVIADYERENPLFKEIVKLAITPMISSSFSLMENANSESEVISLGLSVIMLNIGMYLGVPAIVVIGIRKRI